MRNERLRNQDFIAMRQRGGKGKHGGTDRQQNRRNRKAIRNKLRKGNHDDD